MAQQQAKKDGTLRGCPLCKKSFILGRKPKTCSNCKSSACNKCMQTHELHGKSQEVCPSCFETLGKGASEGGLSQAATARATSGPLSPLKTPDISPRVDDSADKRTQSSSNAVVAKPLSEYPKMGPSAGSSAVDTNYADAALELSLESVFGRKPSDVQTPKGSPAKDGPAAVKPLTPTEPSDSRTPSASPAKHSPGTAAAHPSPTEPSANAETSDRNHLDNVQSSSDYILKAAPQKRKPAPPGKVAKCSLPLLWRRLFTVFFSARLFCAKAFFGARHARGRLLFATVGGHRGHWAL
jgi:hypothetical protein